MEHDSVPSRLGWHVSGRSVTFPSDSAADVILRFLSSHPLGSGKNNRTPVDHGQPRGRDQLTPEAIVLERGSLRSFRALHDQRLQIKSRCGKTQCFPAGLPFLRGNTGTRWRI